MWLGIIGLWRRARRCWGRLEVLPAAVSGTWQVGWAPDLHPVSKSFRTNCLLIAWGNLRADVFPFPLSTTFLLPRLLYLPSLHYTVFGFASRIKYYERYRYINTSNGYEFGTRWVPVLILSEIRGILTIPPSFFIEWVPCLTLLPLLLALSSSITYRSFIWVAVLRLSEPYAHRWLFLRLAFSRIVYRSDLMRASLLWFKVLFFYR